MPNNIKYLLIDLHRNSGIAVEDKLLVSEIWQLDISRYAEIKEDDMNFREYSKRIK